MELPWKQSGTGQYKTSDPHTFYIFWVEKFNREFLICFLFNALNTINSKLKHLNTELQCPAVYTYSEKIYLFERQKKKFKNQFEVFSTNCAISKSRQATGIGNCIIIVHTLCHAEMITAVRQKSFLLHNRIIYANINFMIERKESSCPPNV